MLGFYAEALSEDIELNDGDAPDSFNLLPTFLEDKQVRDHLVISPVRNTHLSLRAGDWMYISNQAGGGFSGPTPNTHLFGGPPAIHFAGQVNSDLENGKVKPDAPKEQLYNLRSDPSQAVNIIRENPVIAQTMREHLAAIQAAKGTR